MLIWSAVKILVPAAASFFVGVLFAPLLADFLYSRQMWKKKPGKVSLEGAATPLFNSLHRTREVGTPKLGGVLIWFSAAATTLLVWSLAQILPDSIMPKLDFLSRSQTWIPLFTLVAGALVGMVDDLLEVGGVGDHIAGGLSLRKRLLIVTIIGLLAASWFYFKLDISAVGVPFWGELELGVFIIPLFTLVMLVLYAGGVIDGIDGLAGGVFAIMFGSYAVIAFYQNQIDLAAFCAVVAGAILAFLWFNIPPARFYMSETGSMALTMTLAIVAFMTDSLGEGYGLSALALIALPLIVTALSVIIQVLSKKWRGGKKVFLVSPLHHHFEAKGWPPYKVAMRYWVLSVVFAILGIIVALISRAGDSFLSDSLAQIWLVL